jgi:hypothetical protein
MTLLVEVIHSLPLALVKGFPKQQKEQESRIAATGY